MQIAYIPKNTQVIGRFMKPLASHYHDLVNVYGNSSSEELRIIILKYSEAFTRDNNMGLAKQVATSLYKRNIQRLTKTFLTLSLSDVASRVQLPSAAEAERYILNMVCFIMYRICHVYFIPLSCALPDKIGRNLCQH